MKTRQLALWGLPLLFAGCGQMQMPGANSPAGAPASTSTATTPPPSAAQRNQEDKAALAKTGQSSAVIATVEDLECKQLIAPFGLSDNATILSEMGVSGFGEWVSAVSEQWLKQFAKQQTEQGRQKATDQTRHQISQQLRTTAMRMNWLPMSVEVMYGQSALDTERKAGRIERRDKNANTQQLYATAQQLLDDTLKAVEATRGPNDPQHDYKFEVYVTTERTQNAVALAGGIILIDPALLKSDPAMRNKAKFAMAHEVAHILRRHETRALQARIIDAVSLRGSVADLARVMRGSNKEPAAVVALVVAGKLQFERHFAFQELAADSCGERVVRTMVNNDNAQTLAVLNAFVASLQDQPATPATASTISPRLQAGTPVGAQTLAAGSTRPIDLSGARAPGAGASKADTSLNTLGDLVTVVTRPIDRHPNTQERIDNFNRLLKERQIALDKAKATKAVTTAAPRREAVPRPARAASEALGGR